MPCHDEAVPISDVAAKPGNQAYGARRALPVAPPARLLRADGARAGALSPQARATLGPELALTGALAAQRPVTDELANHLAAFLLSVVAAVEAKAEDFFFPRAVLKPDALAFDARWALSSHRALSSLFLAPGTCREQRQGRPNDPCPCGSGLKFKRCCGRSAGTIPG